MKCTICKDKVDTKSPFNLKAKNPETNREGWMHGHCLVFLERATDYEKRCPECRRLAFERSE